VFLIGSNSFPHSSPAMAADPTAEIAAGLQSRSVVHLTGRRIKYLFNEEALVHFSFIVGRQRHYDSFIVVVQPRLVLIEYPQKSLLT